MLDVILDQFLDRIGMSNRDDPLMSTAIYLMKLDFKEYIEGLIGDDASPTAVRMKAELRKV